MVASRYTRSYGRRSHKDVMASLTPEEQEKHLARIAKRRTYPSLREKKQRYSGRYVAPVTKKDFSIYFVLMVDERKETLVDLADKLHRKPPCPSYYSTYLVQKSPYWYRYDIPMNVSGFKAWIQKGIAKGCRIRGNNITKHYIIKPN